jgi:hypothetical protein
MLKFIIPIYLDRVVDDVDDTRSHASPRTAEEGAGRNRHCYGALTISVLPGSSKAIVRRCLV